MQHLLLSRRQLRHRRKESREVDKRHHHIVWQWTSVSVWPLSTAARRSSHAHGASRPLNNSRQIIDLAAVAYLTAKTLTPAAPAGRNRPSV